MIGVSAGRKRLVIVEDDERDLRCILEHIDRYRDETGTDIETTVFRSGLDILDEYRPIYDIIFMDIEMPHLDGMNTAKRLREIDPRVGLVFVTNMAQYAIKGYEVRALDFVVKPVTYFAFKDKLEKYFRRLIEEKAYSASILLDLGSSSFQRLAVEDIYYVVKDRNYLVYTTREGEFRVRGTMRSAEETLAGTTVVKCANGCMVNLAHVRKKVRNTVFIGDMQFSVTAPNQEEFTRAMMRYLREGG